MSDIAEWRGALPALTANQMREVDRAMIEDMGITLIQIMENAGGGKIIALDAPSGLDTTSGEIFDPCIRAAAILTRALPKIGLLSDSAREYVGELFVADIGVPPQVYAKMGIQVQNIFAEKEIVRIDRRAIHAAGAV